MRARWLPGVFLLVALSQLGATDCGQIIEDRGFDLWCGEALCAWQLEKGEVRRAATWHSADSGVELVGDDVAIAQLTPVEAADGTCVRFTLVADVAEAAEVRLAVDVFGDGSVESDERIPTSDWRKLTYLVRMPAAYRGVRFRLSKQGTGRAVLANIGAEIAEDAACTTPALAVSRPDGAECSSGAECRSGACYVWAGAWPDYCGACAVDADCAGGALCAVTGPQPGWLAPASQCIAPGALADGLACLRDETCASGRCVDGVCGACRVAADCGGAACLPASPSHPARCDRGRGPGAGCFAHADCDSGVCLGAPLRGCNGTLARECAADLDCPGELTDPDLNTCATVGFAGGSCQ